MKFFSLLSQVEHVLNDRLLQFVSVDLHDVKVYFYTTYFIFLFKDSAHDI